MAWLQVILTVPPEKASVYADFLSDEGAVSVTFQDAKDEPIYEPALNTTPLWQNTTVIALYEAETDIESLKIKLKTILDPQIFSTLKIDPLEDKNWVDAWRDRFQPMHFGHNLWIYPNDAEVPDPNNITAIRLDPGMAFGTGTHPTTRLCLEWLAAHPPKDNLVIDYGSGSGILAIAALRLGAKFAYAVDYDPQAITSTQENAKQNSYEHNILALSPEGLMLLKPEPCDLILANILLNPLMELRDHFISLLKPKGALVVSGVLETQVSLLVKHYQAQSLFEVLEVSVLEEWSRVTLQLKSGHRQ